MSPSQALGIASKSGQAPRADGEPGAVPNPSNVVARVAEFAELNAGAENQSPASLDRLLDVTVSVTAELGRVTLAVGEVLKLGVGSVLQLDRPVSEPVDLVVQGVRLARGEVVVVDDCFAVRIKEIVASKKHP